ncbi:MAG: 5-formyltetrahydrofolate cyclo-ligase [Candidatus Omnitrophica bacterium]|nr:5-formyltetrahydrofolate cyclo-ligase [Candidatus Omnitrophota bacterium]
MLLKIFLKKLAMQIKDIKVLKDNVRKEMKSKLREQPASARRERSRNIQERLVSMEEFKLARTIMSYVSLATEVGTEYVNKVILEMGKRLAVPCLDIEKKAIVASKLESINNLVKGHYGICVPEEGLSNRIHNDEIDLVIVPALAFDRKNMRLGRGEGYYDRFLSSLDLARVKTVGLAFNFQVLEHVPHASHDIPVSLVLVD